MQATLSEPVPAALRVYTDDGADVVSATAAPDIYARPLADSVGAIDCIATSTDSKTDWQVMLAQRKSDACKQWLGTQSLYVIVLLTTPMISRFGA